MISTTWSKHFNRDDRKGTGFGDKGRPTPHGDPFAAGDYTQLEIVSSENGIVRNGKTRVEIKFNNLIECVYPRTGQQTIRNFDASGKVVVRSFEPAITKTRLNNKHRELQDPDGRLRKMTVPAGERTNCLVPLSGRSKCTYILRDQSIAKKLGADGGAIALDLTLDERPRRNDNWWTRHKGDRANSRW